jgi:hypothetical protein
MKLIDNWKDGWRWLSVHALVILAVIPALWLDVPASWKEALPPNALSYIAVAVAVCGIVARLFKEGKLSLSNLGSGKSWFSVWALFLAGAIPLVWNELPADIMSLLPQQAVAVMTSVVSALGLIGRFISQTTGKLQV